MGKVNRAIRAIHKTEAPPPSGKAGNDTQKEGFKISANLNRRASCELKQLAEKTGMTTTQIVNESIVILSYLLDEKGQDRKIYTADVDAEDIREVVLVGIGYTQESARAPAPKRQSAKV